MNEWLWSFSHSLLLKNNFLVVVVDGFFSVFTAKEILLLPLTSRTDDYVEMCVVAFFFLLTIFCSIYIHTFERKKCSIPSLDFTSSNTIYFSRGFFLLFLFLSLRSNTHHHHRYSIALVDVYNTIHSSYVRLINSLTELSYVDEELIFLSPHQFIEIIFSFWSLTI